MSDQPMPCCVLLRCKSMFYRADERPGRLHASDVMHYWCDRTNDPEGPDDGPATPPTCQPGRPCYQAEE